MEAINKRLDILNCFPAPVEHAELKSAFAWRCCKPESKAAVLKDDRLGASKKGGRSLISMGFCFITIVESDFTLQFSVFYAGDDDMGGARVFGGINHQKLKSTIFMAHIVVADFIF